MDKVNIIINGIKVEVPNTYTILDACYEVGVDIPRLCFLKDVNEVSSCRLCVVEVEGIKSLKNSCTVKVNDGMVIKTNTPRIKNTVRRNLQLIAANHKFECWKCPREHNCELLDLLRKYNVDNVIGEDCNFSKKEFITNITDSIVIDSSKCVLCGRCIAACNKYTGKNVLDYNFRGFETYVAPALNTNMEIAGCIYCGKCIQSCPVGAIREKNDIEIVKEMLEDPNIYTVVQVAPSIRAALGEEFGYPIGTNVEDKMFEALHLLGFDDITDTNFAADVTIIEEGNEFISRLNKFLNKENTNLPLFTSCSPGWIRYIETYYPEYLENLSTCKSPQQIQGSLIKNYYASKINQDKKNIRVISIMPCIAKKAEAKREEMEVEGIRDVDCVLTTRELARLIKQSNIDFKSLKGYKPTSPLATYTGAGVIFGATGGVMEAALRYVVKKLEGKELEKLDIKEVRGVSEDIKEATLNVAGLEVNVAIVHGGANIPEMMKRIKEGKKQYAFIEIMGCTGGCVNGGGQPIVNAKVLDKLDVRKLRASVLYNIDKNIKIRSSEINPEVIRLYVDLKEKPNGHLMHKWCHTDYSKKEYYPE